MGVGLAVGDEARITLDSIVVVIDENVQIRAVAICADAAGRGHRQLMCVASVAVASIMCMRCFVVARPQQTPALLCAGCATALKDPCVF